MDKKLIYPDKASVEPPNEDLSEDIKKLYDEAASILNKSPRARRYTFARGIRKNSAKREGAKSNALVKI